MSLNDPNSKEENDIVLSNSLDNNMENYQINEEKMKAKLKNEEEIALNVEKHNQDKTEGSKPYLLYGNHIENLKPKYLGKARAFLFINNYPLIIIGPDCKFIIININKYNIIVQIVIVYVFYQQLL